MSTRRGSGVVGLLVAAAMMLALAAGCSGPSTSVGEAPASAEREAAVAAPADGGAQDAIEASKRSEARKVDPRKGGVEIVLGEWAITSEVGAIRPGEITFVIHNRGTMAHGFEIELEGESSGHGSGSLFKAESDVLQPGESTRMTMTLGPGAYKIECLIDGHDDLGMEDILEVRRDAPMIKVGPKGGADDVIAITDFAFAPAAAHVPAGTEIAWENLDPTPHTVTGDDFGSDTLEHGGTFTHVFDQPGTYAYRCAIHPEMEGKVEVE